MEKNEQKKNEQELLTVTSGDMFQPYDWSVGLFGSRFLAELRDNKKIYGIKCPKCGKVYVPPRKICGSCYVAMDEFVPLSDEGEVYVCTIVHFGFVDPETGKQRPVPYGYAFIKLDGADTCLTHFVNSTDPEKFKVGARVKAVFEEKRKGSIADIKHFDIID
ncbi:MAG: Zn-ribbon domain-containing OB-fold protein [Deltaproteobacteria bacterium]|nr:Zn-ribbon domain-containing OB-fold protein [Deltaproteobacteria bacterium]